MEELVVNPGSTIVVWFSCGAASAVAAKKTIELYGDTCTIIVVNNPVIEEDQDNRRFLLDVEKWIGQPILVCGNKNFPNNSAVEIWNKRKYMSGVNGAPCTSELKKEARYQFELTHKIDYHVLGFTAEELGRHDNFVFGERENLLPVLITLGIHKNDCYSIVEQADIRLPISYIQGYPNANCKGCVKATSPTYWNHVRKVDPEVFMARALQSREIGCKLTRYKGKRLFLDELPPDAKGHKMKSYECGIFCNTK